jgi:TetR/AcrR family transcriptional regulator, cholesterol catabolism regulator
MARRKVTDPKVLVDAAAKLFQKNGYQNTTIDDLAVEVGISKPTIYQHVKSKGWLLESIFESVLRRLKDDQNTIMTTFDDPEEQFRATITNYVGAVTELQTYFRIFFGEEAELPQRTQRKYRAWAREMSDDFASILEACAKKGIVRPDVEPQIASFLIIGMLTTIARWYDPKGRLSPDDIARQVTAIVEGYLIPEGQRTRAKAASR